jgi:hypothetical protein
MRAHMGGQWHSALPAPGGGVNLGMGGDNRMGGEPLAAPRIGEKKGQTPCPSFAASCGKAPQFGVPDPLGIKTPPL